MERGWLETIQLLGLDVMSVVALLMLLLAQLGDLATSAIRRFSHRVASGAGRRERRDVEPVGDTWPPKEWGPSH
jgi:hypothetical protein